MLNIYLQIYIQIIYFIYYICKRSWLASLVSVAGYMCRGALTWRSDEDLWRSEIVFTTLLWLSTLFLRHNLSLKLESPFGLDWQVVESLRSAYLCPHSAGVTGATTVPGFSRGAGDPYSGPHDCTTSLHPREVLCWGHTPQDRVSPQLHVGDTRSLYPQML